MIDFRVQTGWIWDAEFIGYFIGKEEGLYRSRGLNVSFVEGGPLIDPEAALLRGEVDVSISIPDSVAARVAAGDDLIVVGRQYRRDPLAIIVTKDSGRSRLRDLSGASLYVPEVSRTRVQTALAANGIEATDVEYMPFETRPLALAGSGIAVAGYLTSMPDDLRREGAGEVVVIRIDSEDAPAVQNVITTTRETLTTRGDAIRAFLDMSSTGWQRNGLNPSIYPRRFRSTWFNDLDRPQDSEIRHNEQQQPFVADHLALDLEAVKSLTRIGLSHGLDHSNWIAAV